jgi:Cu2+-exporting ATPase
MSAGLAPARSPLGGEAAAQACLHCGLPIGAGPGIARSKSADTNENAGPFCCAGCKAVYGLLRNEHLDAFYDLRGGRGVPVSEASGLRRDTKWLDSIEARIKESPGPARVVLDMQGLHCVGCVWLIQELFGRAPGHQDVVVNPTLGRVDMIVRPEFDVRAFVASVERFGYLFGPPIKGGAAPSRDLLWRLGVCAAIAMNSMIFSIPIYAGLEHGPVFRLFTALNLGLGSLAVAVGGVVFFRSAWRALAQRILHLDLPIALGIALAFAGSVHSYLVRRSQGAYFDTVDVFITLMLLGRFLQERAIERNRAWLLASEGTDGLLARRLREGRVETVPCAELRAGDEIVVAPGDLVPVEARLVRHEGSFSLDWIVGESHPRAYRAGDAVPAGAFSCGNEALVLRAESAFAESPLRELLRSPAAASDTARATPWFQRLSKIYVVGVLAVASAGFVAWWAMTGDAPRALDVTTAVLVVTCPCAFGIAAPLGYEMVEAGLRRAGLYLRRTRFLDRARDVRRVVFDKTGTLTTGSLVVANASALDGLSIDALSALYDLTARSGHPKSAAIRASLDGRRLEVDVGARVVEHPGAGLELVRGGRRWRLGEASWATTAPVSPAAASQPGDTDVRRPDRREGADANTDVVFSVDGEPLASIRTTERLRADAAREVRELTHDGLEVWLLSGDAQPRVFAAAEASGIPRERAIGEQSPHDKASFLEAHDRAGTLFVGDGVNDALALDRALVSGTPAVDRPYVPARADFFFVTAGLAPVRLALRSARALAQVVRVDLAIALAYNALTIALALAGRMSPLLCAILMPASSLTTIGVTVVALSPRSRLWRS